MSISPASSTLKELIATHIPNQYIELTRRYSALHWASFSIHQKRSECASPYVDKETQDSFRWLLDDVVAQAIRNFAIDELCLVNQEGFEHQIAKHIVFNVKKPRTCIIMRGEKRLSKEKQLELCTERRFKNISFEAEGRRYDNALEDSKDYFDLQRGLYSIENRVRSVEQRLEDF
eukprot:gb/GECH01006401.1/.p1 GENE.gb/GECH01006401.1/~~gb/GECH01006401.1/.p1  ORF type:complete len:175 (+),score=14.90 gb/GECH01006401.1/:1-525(+)